MSQIETEAVVTISAKYARIQTSKAKHDKITEIMSSGRLPAEAAFFKTVFSLIKTEAAKGNNKVVFTHLTEMQKLLAQDLLPALGYELSSDDFNFTITW